MKTVAVSGAAPFASAPISTVSVFAAARQWLLYRDTVDTLSKLSRRELADIGADGDTDGFAWRMAAETARR